MKSRRKWVRRGWKIALVLYVLAAVFPYTHLVPTGSLPESDWAELCSDPGVDAADLVTDGAQSLEYRLRLIHQAREQVWISNFMFKPDKTGSQVMAALLAAADRGVQVRVIVDGLIGVVNMGLDPAPYVLGSHPNIEIQVYQPFHLLSPHTFNDRFHEKYMIVDGQWLLLGGRNVSDEFLLESNPAYSYDLEVILAKTGQGTSAVNLAEERFRQCWASRQTVSRYEPSAVSSLPAAEKRRQELYVLNDGMSAALRRPMDAAGFAPVDSASLFAAPLTPMRKSDAVFQAMMSYLGQAEEQAILVSPYFVMDRAMEDALRSAVKQPRSATILTNSAARGNNIIAISDSVFHGGWEERIDASVYELQKPCSLHTKAMLTDHRYCLIGSFNMDMRSAYIDTECMLVLDSPALARQMEAYVNELLSDSAPLNAAAADGARTVSPLPVPWVKQVQIYLLSPLVALFRYLV